MGYICVAVSVGGQHRRKKATIFKYRQPQYEGYRSMGDTRMQHHFKSIGFHLLLAGGVLASIAYLVVLFIGWLLVVQP